MLQQRPVSKYAVALIPCTRGKRADGQTARSLYKGGPFSLTMRHAAMKAEKTLILSAKYGLLELDARVSYYDAYLPALAPDERATLLGRLAEQAEALRGLHLISYLPKAYYLALEEAAPWISTCCVRPYKSLPMLTLFSLLSKELAHVSHSAGR